MLVYGVFESIFALEGLPRVKHPKEPFQSFTCLPEPENRLSHLWQPVSGDTEAMMEEDLKE